MFQWDADTSPDSGGQNVLKTFEMANQHDRQTTRTKYKEKVAYSVAGFIFTYAKNFFSGSAGFCWSEAWKAGAQLNKSWA